MKYWIFFIFLLVFNGCATTSPSYKTKNEKNTNLSNKFKYHSNHTNHGGLCSVQIFGKIHLVKNRSVNSSIWNKTTSKSTFSINKIKYHSYTTINSMNELKDLNTTSTYILFTRNLKEQNKNTKKYKRYNQVLQLIQELKKIKNHNSKNVQMKHENRFVLITNRNKNKNKITVETYNYALANKIIDFFRNKTPSSFFNKEGPFFITVTKNIFDIENEFSFLYLDLSTFNDSAITQVIDSYKSRLIEKGDKDIDILEGWHYHILSAITNFNDNFHLFSVAYAGEE